MESLVALSTYRESTLPTTSVRGIVPVRQSPRLDGQRPLQAELIRRQGPWRTAEEVELATLAWVDWWNNRRLHGAFEGMPPAEFEARHYRQQDEAGEAA